MKKKLGVFFISLTLILLILSNHVQAQLPTIDPEDLKNESIIQGVEDIKEFTEEKKWEFIGERWKEILLKNKFISLMDKTFRQLNFLFFFLFGQDYEFSLKLLFIVMIWIFFWIMFYKVIGDFSTFSEPIAFIIGTLLTIVLAQLKTYVFLSNLVFKIIFFKEGAWGWTSLLLFFVIYFIILIFIERIIWKIGRGLKKSREEKEKWDEKFERQIFRKKVESVEGAFKTIEGGLNG